MCQNFIQIHGHRGVPDGKIFLLFRRGGVEFGGELKYIDNKQIFTKMVLKMMCLIKITCAMNTKT